MKSTGD